MTLEELKDLQQKARKRRQGYEKVILVCTGSACAARGSAGLEERLEGELIKRDLSSDFLVVAGGCLGLCSEGPLLLIQPDGILYTRVAEDDLMDIISQHLQDGRPVERLMYRSGEKICPRMEDIAFFGSQQPVVLENRTFSNPESLDDYLAAGGYRPLARALADMSREEVADVLVASGLRGRGGEDDPTGVKWRKCHEAAGEAGEIPFIICNADDSDPGGFKDARIVESDPHALLEGLLIGAYAIGAREGFVYIRREYPLALKRLGRAIEQARDRNLLGENILQTGFSFDVRVHRGAGAFVCGESSALLAALAGLPPEAHDLYVDPTERGFRGRPTVINNVETLANVPRILDRGPDWFASIGAGKVSGESTSGSTGTRVLGISGDVANTGLVEVPMGTRLRELVFDVAGGAAGDAGLKAVQVGGPTGAILPESGLDIELETDALAEAGVSLGSGMVTVMDRNTCMVRYARYCTDLLLEESCGKCAPCREGLTAISSILGRITGGAGSAEDLGLLEELGGTMRECSICGLGRRAAVPVLSTMRSFPEEYAAHIDEGRCPAGQCTELIRFEIDEGKCTGCTACAEVCPTDAISGEPGETHVIDDQACIRCGMCRDVCRFDAVEVR